MKDDAALKKIELMHATPEEKWNHHLCEQQMFVKH